MIILSGTADIIRVATTTASALAVHASYTDSGNNYFAPNRQNTAIAAIATTTILSAVGSGLTRALKSLNINARGGANTVTVEYFDGATAYQLQSIALALGESLEYEDAAGWRVRAADGSVKSGGSTGGMLSQLSTTNGDFPVGTTVWTTASQIPPGQRFRLITIPSGSSGASGNVTTLTGSRSGSTGAGGVARGERWVSRAQMIAALPISIVVPAGVSGPAGVPSIVAAFGTAGTQGAPCSFGNLLSAYPGAPGIASGSNSTPPGGGGLLSSAVGVQGGAPAIPAAGGSPGIGGGGANGGVQANGSPAEDGGAAAGLCNSTATAGNGGNSLRGGGAGGGGGGHASSGLGLDGGFGGATLARSDGLAHGSGAAPGTGGLGAAGSNGANAAIGSVGDAGGGGSGNGTSGAPGGKGGNGGVPGGAGGGGGTAETDGVTPATGGAGGDGARGEAVLEAFA